VLIPYIQVMDTSGKPIPSRKRQVKASESHNDGGKRYMVTHTPFADMAGTTSRARSPVGVNGDGRQRLVAGRETRQGRQAKAPGDGGFAEHVWSRRTKTMCKDTP
jgi:hypothetical protein